MSARFEFTHEVLEDDVATGSTMVRDDSGSYLAYRLGVWVVLAYGVESRFIFYDKARACFNASALLPTTKGARPKNDRGLWGPTK